MSEYWNRSSPDVLHQEIARRAAEPRAKQEIAKALACERLEFKILWNRSLVINQLPNELLIQIFKFNMVSAYLAAVVNVAPERTTETTNPRFWRLMRVCRHWREVIVGTPAFWCSVHFRRNTTNWNELCLARSVAAPIDIATLAHISDWCGIEYLTVMDPLIHRIGSLYFGLNGIRDPSDPDVLATLPLLFRNGMPALEGLHLAMITDGWPGGPPNHLPIDIELTCQRFPRLYRLALTGIAAPRDASFYTQLRTLSLTTCSHRLSFDRFLDTLASCTGLKLLDLRDTVDRLSGDWMRRDATPSRPLISFPHLTKFVLSGHGAVCTSRFLAHFHIHSSVRLAISADAEDRQVDAPFRDGARSMAAMLPPSHAVTLEPLAAAKEIHMWMSFGPDVEIDTPGPPAGVLLRMRLAPDGQSMPSRWGSVADLVQLLGRSPLTALSVSSILPNTVAAWAGVFRTFPLLERLSMRGFWDSACALGMENAFLGLHAASESTADPGSPVACPNLTQVSIHGFGSTAVYEAIRTCLRYRGDRGVVLAELNIDLADSEWNLSPARCRACVKDIVDCTERLVGLRMDESEEGENLRAAETEPGRRQGDARGVEWH